MARFEAGKFRCVGICADSVSSHSNRGCSAMASLIVRKRLPHRRVCAKADEGAEARRKPISSITTRANEIPTDRPKIIVLFFVERCGKDLRRGALRPRADVSCASCFGVHHNPSSCNFVPCPPFSRITHDPNVMGGKPCIRGLRVTVGIIVGMVAAGHSHDDILRLYPYLAEDDFREALSYAADSYIRRRAMRGSPEQLLELLSIVPDVRDQIPPA